MNLNKKLGIVGFALSMAMAQATFACHSDEKAMCGCGKHMEKMITSLHLDKAQKQKVEAIKAKFKKDMAGMRHKIYALRVETNNIVTSDKIDQGKLDDLISKKKELTGKIMKERITARHEIYTFLTPEQKIKYQEMAKKWQDKAKVEIK